MEELSIVHLVTRETTTYRRERVAPRALASLQQRAQEGSFVLPRLNLGARVEVIKPGFALMMLARDAPLAFAVCCWAAAESDFAWSQACGIHGFPDQAGLPAAFPDGAPPLPWLAFVTTNAAEELDETSCQIAATLQIGIAWALIANALATRLDS